jgi:hypothetical protein
MRLGLLSWGLTLDLLVLGPDPCMREPAAAPRARELEGYRVLPGGGDGGERDECQYLC